MSLFSNWPLRNVRRWPFRNVVPRALRSAAAPCSTSYASTNSDSPPDVVSGRDSSYFCPLCFDKLLRTAVCRHGRLRQSRTIGSVEGAAVARALLRTEKSRPKSQDPRPRPYYSGRRVDYATISLSWRNTLDGSPSPTKARALFTPLSPELISIQRPSVTRSSASMGQSRKSTRRAEKGTR